MAYEEWSARPQSVVTTPWSFCNGGCDRPLVSERGEAAAHRGAEERAGGGRAPGRRGRRPRRGGLRPGGRSVADVLHALLVEAAPGDPARPLPRRPAGR